MGQQLPHGIFLLLHRRYCRFRAKKAAPMGRFLEKFSVLLGGVLLRGAGNRVLLVGHYGLNQLHRAAEAQCAAVEAEIIGVHCAPLLRGIVFAVGRAALIRLLNQRFGLLRRYLLPLRYPSDTVLHGRADKQAQPIGVLCQRIIGAPANDDAGPLPPRSGGWS